MRISFQIAVHRSVEVCKAHRNITKIDSPFQILRQLSAITADRTLIWLIVRAVRSVMIHRQRLLLETILLPLDPFQILRHRRLSQNPYDAEPDVFILLLTSILIFFINFRKFRNQLLHDVLYRTVILQAFTIRTIQTDGITGIFQS